MCLSRIQCFLLKWMIEKRSTCVCKSRPSLLHFGSLWWNNRLSNLAFTVPAGGKLPSEAQMAARWHRQRLWCRRPSLRGDLSCRSAKTGRLLLGAMRRLGYQIVPSCISFISAQTLRSLPPPPSTGLIPNPTWKPLSRVFISDLLNQSASDSKLTTAHQWNAPVKIKTKSNERSIIHISANKLTEPGRKRERKK